MMNHKGYNMMAWSCQQFMGSYLVILATPDYDDARADQLELLVQRIYESVLVGYGDQTPPKQ